MLVSMMVAALVLETMKPSYAVRMGMFGQFDVVRFVGGRIDCQFVVV